ncbi:MAG: universal stress protein [Chloroflexota bacterium]
MPRALIEHQEQVAAEAIQTQVEAISSGTSQTPSTKVIVGQDYSDILQHAIEQDADLLVLGIHRHSAVDMFKGTTVERVVRYGTVPVLVVRDAVTAPYRRVLVPVDLSSHSKAAMRLAAQLAPGGEVHLVHATHEPFKGFLGAETLRQHVRDEQAQFSKSLEGDMAALSAEFGAGAPSFQVHMRVGDVAVVIRNEVERMKPDLLALGTHGRSGLAQAILGSVAEDLLADAPVDVAAVKARA